MVFTSTFQILHKGRSLEEAQSHEEPTLYVSLRNVVFHFPTCSILDMSCYKESGMQLAELICNFSYN